MRRVAACFWRTSRCLEMWKTILYIYLIEIKTNKRTENKIVTVYLACEQAPGWFSSELAECSLGWAGRAERGLVSGPTRFARGFTRRLPLASLTESGFRSPNFFPPSLGACSQATVYHLRCPDIITFKTSRGIHVFEKYSSTHLPDWYDYYFFRVLCLEWNFSPVVCSATGRLLLPSLWCYWSRNLGSWS